MNKPSIVLAIFTLQGGGAERFALTLGKAFFELGFEVHIISFKSEIDYLLDNDIHYHILDYKKYRWIPKSWRNRIFAKVFDSFIDKNITNPSLILSNLYQVDCVLHYSRFNIAYVIHNTLSIEYNLNQNRDKITHLKSLYQNHPVICVSHGVKNDFIHYLGNHRQITAIHNPIPKSDIIKLAENNIELPQNCQNGYLIHVGKFKPQKNHIGLIQAYAKSSMQYPLVLLGTGGEMVKCKELVNELNLADKVIFKGFCSNPYPYIKNAIAMVLSSDFEGFGIVIAESLALGVPVISTDCPSGPAELLPPQNLVAIDNIQALADKMSDIMANPQAFHLPFNQQLLPHNVAKQYLHFMNIPI